MATDIKKVSGIGASAAASLSEAGYTSAEEVANATPEELGKVKGFGPERTARIIAAAKALLDENEKPATSVVEPVEAIEVEAAPVEEPAEVSPEEETVEVDVEEKEEVKAKQEVEVEVQKDEPKVDPVVAATATGRFAALRRPRVLISALVVVAIAGMAAANPEVLTGLRDSVSNLDTSTPVETAVQDEKNETAPVVDQPDEPGQETTTTETQIASAQNSEEPAWVAKQRAEAEKLRAEAEKRFSDQQKAGAQIAPEPEWVKKQRAEAEKVRAEVKQRIAEQMKAGSKAPVGTDWVKKQHAEAMKLRADARKRFNEQLRAGFQAPAEPAWVREQRAKAMKLRADAQKRANEQFKAGFQAPVEPEWVKKQRAQAEKYRLEAHKKMMETNRQYAHYAATPRYGVPYGSPVPYGYVVPGQAPVAAQ